MKKQILIICSVVVLLVTGGLLFCYFYGQEGHVKHAERTLGSSEHFTKDELNMAADFVTEYFRQNFKGCKLQSLTFDEQRSERAKGSGYNSTDTIVLFSDFIAYPTSGTPENIAIKNHDFDWILRKDENGVNGWKLLTWGYA